MNSRPESREPPRSLRVQYCTKAREAISIRSWPREAVFWARHSGLIDQWSKFTDQASGRARHPEAFRHVPEVRVPKETLMR